MASNIDPQLKTIKQYFDYGVEVDNRQLVIPEFQRAYSWGIEQCDELWNDIDLYFQTYNGQKDIIPYFFGCVIFSEDKLSTDLNNGEKLETVELKIIDGQQRTITFLLLLKAIQLRIDEFLYGSWEFEDKKLKSDLIRTTTDLFGMLYRERTTYLRDSWDDIRSKTPVIISRSINEIKNNSQELDLYKILRMEKFEDAEKKGSTERVNEINKQGLSKKSPKRFSLFYRNFKFFYDKLGEVSRPKQLKDWVDFFLSKCQIIQISSKDVGQAISMFNALNSKGMNLSDSDLVCSYLAVKAEEADKKGAYLESGKSYSQVFQEKWQEFVYNVSCLPLQSKGRNLDEKEAEKRKSILNQYMYYVRACDGETDSVLSVRDFYNSKIEKNEDSNVNFDPIVTCDALIKLALIWDKILDFPVVRVLLKLNSNAQYFLISYLYKYDIEEITLDKVESIAENLLRLFAILRINGDSYSKSEFKGWLFNNNVSFVKRDNENNVKESFESHIRTKFKQDDVHENLLEQVDNSIVFLNEYLYAKEHHKLEGFGILSTTEVEHIMPQSGGENEAIMNDAGLTEKDFELYLEKIGNKILLEANINKHISNNWFRQKKSKKVTDKAGYINSKFPIAISLTSYDSDMWTKDDIDKATEKAADRILKFIFLD